MFVCVASYGEYGKGLKPFKRLAGIISDKRGFSVGRVVVLVEEEGDK